VKENTHRIPVTLEKDSYEIVIKLNGLSQISKEIEKIGIKKGTKILIVTNQDIADLYATKFTRNLEEFGYKTNLLVLTAGEEQKNPKTLSLIHDAAYAAKLERGSIMIALGGGVVGDITGFAAATWLRGVSVIQVPTTLLAMVDASIGGKTGINHHRGKNLIGAFHQPKLVLIDPSTLQSLPVREFRAGMAEVIKYAIIGDFELFKTLQKLDSFDQISKIPINTLIEIIIRSATEKARIVCLDEKESGIRAILNYGHTFGHVIENLTGYGTWLHGEAVAIGMIVAGKLALQLGKWSEDENNSQLSLIKKSGLPTEWPELKIKEVIRSLEGDKKVKDGIIRFVLPNKIGEVEIRDDIQIRDIANCINNL
tara:strand:+ start:4914 stop:6017 length:1104 start_codon:yes stop_codon:yes gene_type:complete